MGRRVVGFVGAVVVAFGLAGCFLFPTTVTRDVRAAWDPAGTSILIVQSTYDTTNPRNPYHADIRARSFFVKLFVHDTEHGLTAADVDEIDPIAGFAARRLIDEFTEQIWVDDENRAFAVSLGGFSQYTPVYWFPEHDRAVFVLGKGAPMVRNVGSRTSTWFPRNNELLESLLSDAYGLASSASAIFADWIEYVDAVPSPDGAYLALMFNLMLLDQQSLDAEWYVAVLLYRIEPKELMGGVVPLADVNYMPQNIDATYPLESENGHHAYIVWNQTSDGFAVFYLADRDNVELRRRMIRVTFNAASYIESSGALAFSVTELGPEALVPRRPIATSSGPVDAAGRALTLAVNGNETRLSLTPFPESPVPGLFAWRPFYNPEMIDLGTWTTPQGGNATSEASRYGFW
ncbi:MAG: hypothetical protein EA426_15165 [Spirochaetaceae bacterium]|nr:MAG: hypothetical protein EA426_15165 [Spirochaetaceae bacterium]